MSIYVDVSAAVHRRAGLGRYAENLARALLELIPDELAFFYNAEHGIEPLAGLENIPSRTVALGYKPWRMLVWLGQAAGAGFNRLVPGASLFHATEHLLPPLHGVPGVLTVHDLIFRHLPEHHKRLNRWYLNLTMPLFCRRAAHVIAISQATRRDLIAAYGVPEDKISVIYEAADPSLLPTGGGGRVRGPRRVMACPRAICCSWAPSSRARTWAACSRRSRRSTPAACPTGW